MQRAQIEKILHDELERAGLLYDAETKAFGAATKEMILTDPDHPDRTAAIRTAGEGRRSALHAYSRALKRFTDFIVNGVVPDDLKGTDTSTDARYSVAMKAAFQVSEQHVEGFRQASVK